MLKVLILMGENINIMNRNTEAASDGRREVDPEVNPEKNKQEVYRNIHISSLEYRTNL
jgi:hypothetical protein